MLNQAEQALIEQASHQATQWVGKRADVFLGSMETLSGDGLFCMKLLAVSLLASDTASYGSTLLLKLVQHTLFL